MLQRNDSVLVALRLAHQQGADVYEQKPRQRIPELGSLTDTIVAKEQCPHQGAERHHGEHARLLLQERRADANREPHAEKGDPQSPASAHDSPLQAVNTPASPSTQGSALPAVRQMQRPGPIVGAWNLPNPDTT